MKKVFLLAFILFGVIVTNSIASDIRQPVPLEDPRFNGVFRLYDIGNYYSWGFYGTTRARHASKLIIPGVISLPFIERYMEIYATDRIYTRYCFLSNEEFQFGRAFRFREWSNDINTSNTWSKWHAYKFSYTPDGNLIFILANEESRGTVTILSRIYR